MRVLVLSAVLLLVAASAAWSAGPVVMPGFPVRAGGNVIIMWLPVPGATAYSVNRGEAPGGPYKKIGEGPSTNFMDQNVPNDKDFYYVIKSIVGAKEGESSVEVVLKGLEPMKAPKIESHLITQDNKIAIRWGSVPKAAFFNVYRSEKGPAGLALVTSIQDTRFTDTKVEIGKTYTYAITAVSTANVESAKSAAYDVKLEKQAAAGGAVAAVNKPVKYVDAFDSDEALKIALKGPRALSAAGPGEFLVTDASGKIYDVVAKDLKIKTVIGVAPADFKGPWGTGEGSWFDAKKNEVYVCFPGVNAVRVFKTDGELLRAFPLPMPDPKTTAMTAAPRPNTVAVGPNGTVYVVDATYYQVVMLTPDGRETGRIGLPRDNPGRGKPGDHGPATPGLIGVSAKGDVYVTENIEQRVAVFGPDGKFLRTFGRGGTLPGGILRFGGMAVRDDGSAIVADGAIERVQLFGPDGAYAATYIDPKIKDPQKQPRIAPSSTGIAVSGKQLFTSSLFQEKVTIYDLPD